MFLTCLPSPVREADEIDQQCRKVQSSEVIKHLLMTFLNASEEKKMLSDSTIALLLKATTMNRLVDQ